MTIGGGTIKRATPEPAATPETPDSCQVGLSVTRVLEGELDPAFKGGAIRAESTSSRQITSVP